MTTKAKLLKTIRLACNECMGGTRAGENKKGTIERIKDIDECTAPECAFTPLGLDVIPDHPKAGSR